MFEPTAQRRILLGATAVLCFVVTVPRDSIAASAQERLVERLARIGRTQSPSWSPDGSRLAFVSDLSGSLQVWTVDARGGWPHLVTSLPETARWVSWAPAGDWLAIGSREGIYVSRSDGRQLDRVSDRLEERYRCLGWSRRGDELLFSLRENSRNVVAWSVRNESFRTLATDLPRMDVLGWSGDEQRYLLRRWEDKGKSDLYLFDLDERVERLLTPHHERAAVHGGTLSPDTRVVYFSDDRAEHRTFSRVRIAEDGTPGPIEVLASREDASLFHHAISPDGRRALLAWNVDAQDELEILDLRRLKARPVPPLPAEMSYDAVWSPDGSQVALRIFGTKAPLDIWILDVKRGTFRQATHAQHPGVDLEALIRPESVRFRAHDGLELQGWLYRSPGVAEPAPYVITFHGGPDGHERTALSRRTHYQGLVSRGVGVFAPNVRGSSGFGKTFRQLDDGPLRFDGIRDIESCAKYLVDNGIADPARLGIMGESYGGYMTWQGLTRYPELFAAGAPIFGITDLEVWFERAAPATTAVFRKEFGDPEREIDLLRRLSPVHQLAEVRAPVLVLHGALDRACPIEDTDRAVELLKARGVPVEYVRFEDEGHGFRREENRVVANVALVDFFVKHLTSPAAADSQETSRATGR